MLTFSIKRNNKTNFLFESKPRQWFTNTRYQ